MIYGIYGVKLFCINSKPVPIFWVILIILLSCYSSIIYPLSMSQNYFKGRFLKGRSEKGNMTHSSVIWLRKEEKKSFRTDWQIPTIVVKLGTIYRLGIFLLLYFSLKIIMLFVIFKVLIRFFPYESIHSVVS